MGWATGIAAALAAVSGVATNVSANKARADARYKMAQDIENFKKSLEQQKVNASGILKQREKEHTDNMNIWKKEFEANQKAMNYQLAQADTGLQLQAQAIHNAQMESNRQLANQKASIERQINQQSENRQQAHYQKKDDGVAGTLLTGPGGVKEGDLKKQKKTLLGQ